MPSEFTPTQQAILGVLSDGKAHSKQELHRCLPDELASMSALRTHLCRMRPALWQRGQDVLAIVHRRRTCYQLVQLLPGTIIEAMP